MQNRPSIVSTFKSHMTIDTDGNQSLNLNFAGLNDTDIDDLCLFLLEHPKITELDLSWNVLLTTPAIVQLTKALLLPDINIQTLILDGLNLSTEAINALRRELPDTSVTNLQIGCNPVNKETIEEFETICTNPKLQTIGFEQCQGLSKEEKDHLKRKYPMSLKDTLLLNEKVPSLLNISLFTVKNNPTLLKQINLLPVDVKEVVIANQRSVTIS